MTSARARDHLLTLAASAAASWATHRLARRLPQRIRSPWERTNHAGRTVTLLEGPAFVAGALTAATLPVGARRGQRVAAAVTAGVAGALGALDDLAGGAADKGLRGHLAALRRGQVTTGAVKVVGLAATGLAAAALTDRDRRGPLSTLLGGAVVAGAANAVNLFDLRPGRALKVTVAAGLPLVTGTPGAAAVGSSLGVIGDDLAARSMLGDTGANAAGALVGLAVVERTGLLGRAVALAGLAALTLASERVSFTRVIEGNGVLRHLDEWGRETR
ncbi:hypothetical protein [Terrabacter sp. MAHUQ-38]|uniref:hypothetical protein n=1 Tax=unclassified Terrabacter TaxID=2630222 RepID=UPI00165D4715|nr:hypothetical protein [Terrabacter sp. MAHUQ-38]